MANFLASIFGTELDKVNCSFYFVSPTKQSMFAQQVFGDARPYAPSFCLDCSESSLIVLTG